MSATSTPPNPGIRIFTVRLASDDGARLEAACERLGLSPHEFIRRATNNAARALAPKSPESSGAGKAHASLDVL